MDPHIIYFIKSKEKDISWKDSFCNQIEMNWNYWMTEIAPYNSEIRRMICVFPIRKNFLQENHFILHRTDGPAIEYINGKECWYLNNELHREDGPAVLIPWIGVKKWYLNNKLERTEKEKKRNVLKKH